MCSKDILNLSNFKEILNIKSFLRDYREYFENKEILKIDLKYQERINGLIIEKLLCIIRIKQICHFISKISK